ncbi:hypothetical protein Cgig2_016622 [Carnegiea gigantea]|uniref:Nitrate regulatory gene2 protein-like n=1 Tax=Carnegiea gigantea TaxID=171969 RepID=A0A9Q1QSJ2_9CARY|nr:hypothetical protein Cgig2_016622 [Carnegiea gigantea]
MGCSQSKIENEEAVSRCKDRKLFMKSAVTARNAFAAAHSSYAMSLKNTGAALSDFAQGEVLNALSHPPTPGPTIPSQPPPPPPSQILPPAPPPPPMTDTDMPPHPLQRAVSMPEFAVSKPLGKRGSEATIEEEEEDEEEEEEDVGRLRTRGSKGGSVGGRMETGVAAEVPPPPSPPPPPDESRTPPPPPPSSWGATGNSSWDYFFNVDNIPGGTLGDVEEMREENAHKLFDESSKRAAASETTAKSSNDDASARIIEEKLTPEKPVAEKPPLPPGGQQGGKVLKKGKQVVGPGPAMSMNNGVEGKRRNVSLVQIFNELDDCFLKASESVQDVTKMLEAARLHYHSNFADTRGHLDHSARVMRVITWNRSFRGLTNNEDFKDDFDSEENETHATVLDKLLAWEKKLYDEVKAGEIMKFDYQRKVALLNKQKKRGSSAESLEKTKAAVSHLHTRYIVDMQSMDSTVSEINRLRDEQLYPKLVALVDAMATMWDVMREHHENQKKMANALRLVDISQSTKETTDHHHERTIQLWAVVQEWHAQFDKMVNYQKEYIRALNSWLKLNLIPIESSLKEKVSSPPRAQHPPIQGLLLAWHDLLEKLPDEHAKSTIYNFAAILHTIVQQQEDELKLRAKVEESRRDLEKKKRQFEKWRHEYMEKRMSANETEPGEDGIPKDELMVEREFVVENAKRKLVEDEENYQRQCLHVREKALTSLKTRLPELFRALSEFALASSDMYTNLKAVARSQTHKHKEAAA